METKQCLILDPILPFTPTLQSSPRELTSEASTAKDRKPNLKRKSQSLEKVHKEIEEANLKLQFARVKLEQIDSERNLDDTVIIVEEKPTSEQIIETAVKKFCSRKEEKKSNQLPKDNSNTKTKDKKSKSCHDSRKREELKREQRRVTEELKKLKAAPSCTESIHDLYIFASFIRIGVDVMRKFKKPHYLHSLDTVKSIIAKLPFTLQLRCIDYMSCHSISRSGDLCLLSDYLSKEANKCAPFINFEIQNVKSSK